MSAATSPGTGLAYGLQRVCAAWGFARSSFYAMKSRQQATAERPPAKRRGPKPSISDEALLVAIEADLEASPWEGEGHRKVWARLRVCRGIRVSRKRVLRVMRENNLLSPHRCRRRGGNPHVGEIITHAPNLMWGTDGVRVFTVDDGWGWIFTAIEHWNAECVGWHVCKRGDRFAALQPISMGLARLYASTSAGAARGLALRMDHGSQGGFNRSSQQLDKGGCDDDSKAALRSIRAEQVAFARPTPDSATGELSAVLGVDRCRLFD